MTNAMALIVCAIIVEAAANVITGIKIVKTLNVKITQVDFKVWISLAFAISICAMVKIDVLELFLEADPSKLGIVISGLLTSRGSNFIHDILKKVKSAPNS